MMMPMRLGVDITVWLILAAPQVVGVNGSQESAARGRAGEPAPPFTWEELIQGPVDTKPALEALRGRVVVIDFWSIGCGPCVRAIPRWNKLAERFSDKPYTFIAVTDDKDCKALRRFLDEHPIRGWVAVDSDRSMFRAYGVRGIPATVLIDPTGVVAGWDHVTFLEEEPAILEHVLRGDSVKLSQQASVDQPDLFAYVSEPLDGSDSGSGKAICLVLIRPASGARGLGVGSDRERRSDSVTLRQAILSYYPVRGRAIQFEFDPPEETYDIMFRWPSRDVERGKAVLREALEAAFEITVTVEKRTTDVFVMTVDKERVAAWPPGQDAVHSDPETGHLAPTKAILERMNAGEEFFFTLGTTRELADAFSFALDLPVVDETGVDGYFTFCFPWSKENSTADETIALAKRVLGVTLTRTRLKIDVHVVRRRSSEEGRAPDKGNR